LTASVIYIFTKRNENKRFYFFLNAKQNLDEAYRSKRANYFDKYFKNLFKQKHM